MGQPHRIDSAEEELQDRMGSSVAATLAQYRLIFVQPDPENGDRVCVGILVEDRHGPPELVYDAAFSKVSCVAPALDIELLRFFLQDLENALQRSPEPAVTLQQYSPQLTTSQARSIVTPVTDSVKARLLERYALVQRPTKTVAAEAKLAARVHARAEIQRFVERIAAPLNAGGESDDVVPDVRTSAPTKLLRFPAVRDRVGLSHSTLWRLRRSGEFPMPIRISPGAVAWRESDIEEWIASRAVVGPPSKRNP